MDAAEIESLYRRHAPMVLRRCRQILADEQLAEEAMQDVFVNVVRDSARLDGRAPVSFLWQVATNVSLNLLRSRRRRPEAPDTDLVQRIALAAPAESQIAALQLIEKLFRRQKAGTGLIAVLHFVDGMTLEEVAHEVGMSVSGVRRRLGEIKRRMDQIGDVP